MIRAITFMVAVVLGAALGIGLMLNAAFAKDFTVSDQDQMAVATICATAARSPAVSVDVNAQIANWCVQWSARMQAANAPSPPAKEDNKK